MNAIPLPAAHHGFRLPDLTRKRRFDVGEALAVILVLCVWSTLYATVCPPEPMHLHARRVAPV